MSAKPKLNPLFFAPFVSSVMRPEPAWIDDNNHLNMAYYPVLFDRAAEEMFDKLMGDVVEGRKAIEPYVTYTAEGDVDMVFCKSCVEETKLFAVKMPGYARNRDDVTCDRCKVAL